MFKIFKCKYNVIFNWCRELFIMGYLIVMKLMEIVMLKGE